MDPSTFDTATKALARALSRRRFLEAVTLAVGAGWNIFTNAGAQAGSKQPATVPLGAPCETNEQCAVDHAEGLETFLDRDPAPICGDNEIDKDGAGNCCKPPEEFAFCRSDADCCGNAVCVGIKMLGVVCRPFDQLDLGMSCTRTIDCYGQTRGFNMLCDANGAGQQVCCVNGGGWLGCFEDGHCCGNAICQKEQGADEGICVDPVDRGLALGAACSEGGILCSQTDGPTICADNGDWYDFDLNCCREDGGACRQDHDCCAKYICVDGACTLGGDAPKRWGDIGGVHPPHANA